MWWYITRATGIVATVLLGLSLVWGLTFSSRETGQRLKPNWWLDLHNMLGGLTLAFTVAHVLAVIVDPDSGFNVTQAVDPGQASDVATAITYGIVAMYLLVVVVATSWPRLRFRRRAWRMLHLLSIPAAVLTVLHALQAGSDGQSRGLQVRLTVGGGRVTDVSTLQLPSSKPKSVRLSNTAVTTLKPKVLSTQSTSVNAVSGATLTSRSYLASIQSAIDAARAAGALS